MASTPNSNRIERYEDDASVRSASSFTDCSFFSQCTHIFLLLLKLKLWLFLLLPFTVLLLLSSLYVSLLLKPSAGSLAGLQFYGAAEFAAEGRQYLVDRGAFPDEVRALEAILANRDGKANLLSDCSTEKICRTEFISESDSKIAGYIRFSKDSNTCAIAECFWQGDSSLRCAYLYQLMAQAIHEKNHPNDTFKNVRLFRLNGQPVQQKDLQLPQSVCNDWIKRGKFEESLSIVLKVSLSLITLGVGYYFLITTVSCIRDLKRDGFLHEQFRNGLSVTAYWTAIWLLTFLESLLFSVIFALSHALHCSGVYPFNYVIFAFLAFNLYCLTLAALLLLLELLMPYIMVLTMCMMVLAILFTVAFLYYSEIVASAPFAPFLFPPIHIDYYIFEYLSGHIVHKLTGNDPTSEHSLHLLAIILSIAGTLLYIVLVTLYLDCMLQNGNGMCLPWHFPFSCKFWYPGREDTDEDDLLHEANRMMEIEDTNIEPVNDLPPAIIAYNITKTFRKYGCCADGPLIFKGLSCTIYENQITALIGHNGAGKSTLIKILIGDEPADEGTVFVAGLKVSNPLERVAIRGNIGVCLQVDSLCASMTVMESIEATITSKGADLDSEMIKAEAMIERLGLQGKEDSKIAELSGGQKRKVSTIQALLGDPEVVILDEPTSGLDPVSRRKVWQLLREKRIGRCIVLCTQFMDEADILADRKIFICGGEVVCAGSSMFLKKLFDCSLGLSVSLRSAQSANALLSRLRGVRIKRQFKTELLLEVTASDQSGALIEAVKTLEDSKNIVAAFGLCKPTLEDVFTKLSGVTSVEIAEAVRSRKLAKFMDEDKSETTAGTQEEAKQNKKQKKKLQPSVFKQLKALFLVNLKRQVRSRSRLFSRFILPIILIFSLGFFTYTFMSVKKFAKNHSKRTASSNIDVKRETDTYHSVSYMRSTQLASVLKTSHIICIRDYNSEPMSSDLCSELRLSSESKEKDTYVVLNMTKEETFEDFLKNPDSQKRLRDECNATDQKSPCILYHASSWSPKESNRMRNIYIGVFIPEFKTELDTAHAFRRAFSKISAIFRTETLQNSTALSHLRPISQYKSLELDFLLFLLILILFPVLYVTDLIEDATSKVRCQLVAMGMSKLAYWVNTFFLHWIQYAIFVLISVSLLMMWERYRNVYFILMFCLPAFFLGTASNQLVVYVVAAISQSSSTMITMCYAFMLGFLPSVLAFLSTSGPAVVIPLIWLLPPVALIALGYFAMIQSIYMQEYYHLENVDDIPNIYKTCWGNLYYLMAFIAVPIHIVCLCCIIIMLENRTAIYAACCLSIDGDDDSNKEIPITNQNVVKEAARVFGSRRNMQNVLELAELSKTHPNGVRAVYDITFGAMAGEILGLVGVNGAGKTTTLSLAIGETIATSGTCEVRSQRGNWISCKVGAAHGAIGYCPQHSPLFNCITVVEHLQLYADIRGLPSSLVDRETASLMSSLGLQPYRNVRAGQLSSGNRRRLCLAIALLGDPALVVIDEASTGVDPQNRRFIWSAVRGMMRPYRSVLFTSHSMDEVEALCNRVGIINNGRLIEFSTVHQLRGMHGDAYTLEILMRPLPEKQLQQKKNNAKGVLVAVLFDGATVIDDVGLCLKYYVPRPSLGRLSDALAWLADNYAGLGIQYYSLHQMSLDQVFVKLVKQCDK